MKNIFGKCIILGERIKTPFPASNHTEIHSCDRFDAGTSNVLGLMRHNALNYEKLKDDKAGLSSVRVNDQYRIEFEEHTKDGETVATICNITDLSNHYK